MHVDVRLEHESCPSARASLPITTPLSKASDLLKVAATPMFAVIPVETRSVATPGGPSA